VAKMENTKNVHKRCKIENKDKESDVGDDDWV